MNRAQRVSPLGVLLLGAPLLALSLLAAALMPAEATAQAPDDPARLFPREAVLELGGARGVVRLPLPIEVLDASRPDLSDVRVHRADGGEVPYVVDGGLLARETRYTVTPVRAERRTERGDSLRAIAVERFELAPPRSGDPSARLTLFVEASASDFVRRITVRTDDGRPLADATVFRLPSPTRERLFVELPPFAADRQLEVELAGEGGYLEPTFAVAATSAPIEPVRHVRPLAASARRTAEGRSVLELPRPLGLRPDSLRIVTSQGTFTRRVRVFDVRDGEAAEQIGAAVVFRVESLSLESLSVPIGEARGERLRVEITDADAAPLPDIEVEAVVQQPSLLFDSGAEPLTLRFGGGRARPPHYDLAALLATRLGEQVGAAALPRVALGALRENPAFDDAPALAFAMRPGRAPELARFTHVADLVVRGAREGLSRVRVPPSVQSLARDDLGDLRVVGADGRQQPYLVSPTDVADRVQASVEVQEADHATRYVLRPASGRARVQRVVLQPDAAYVARPYTLEGVDASGDRRELSRGMLRRAPDDLRALSIALNPTWVERLELVVEDGNDAPLHLEQVTVDVVSPTLFLAAPDGQYRVFVGDPAAAPPTYEIARAPAWVLGVRSAAAEVSAPVPNPAHVEPPWHATVDAQAIGLWGVLVVALLVLLVLTLRLAKAEPPSPDDVPEGEASEASAPSGGEVGRDEEPPSDAEASKPVRF